MATDVTRTRLLDAAEHLLTTTPYEDLRLRAVCAQAGVNPAAVHYHFGSRESLVTALLQDRLEPFWAAPLNELAHGRATVREIVDAILAPLARLRDDPVAASLLKLLGRFVLARPDLPWTATWFQTQAWVAILTSTTGVDDATALRRWRFAFAILMTELSAPTPPSVATVEALGDFLTAGLNAPVSNTPIATAPTD
ncbi:TetR/AcrR family transcriptional regulator [Gordonia sp. HY442]|uniref:TetR/AcrR family transcriptional regulator n=1 Tax=Gordonia zhenghanii TaxID=2911516 RepID=UPI001F222BD4|nr:TetR/AcrR family transcriptional regulator [Gordonia zhenghanii]MCF8603314.1 TetR/AcrR family transcriptional regulator [Gordonia zhenghanii]